MNRTKEQLVDVIERLYQQWENEADKSLKIFLENQVRKYALQYKEVTGDYYIRNGNPTTKQPV
jgi:hypothetical protein